MASEEIEAALQRCPSPNGCFAAHPEVVTALLGTCDPLLSATHRNIIEAAAEAGQAGLPLEEATFTEAVLREVGISLGLLSIWGENGTPIIEESKMVRSLLEGDTRTTAALLAQCAYACGKAGDSCPLVELDAV